MELWHCESPVEIKIDAPKLYRPSYMGGYIKSISSNALASSHAIYDFPREMAIFAPSGVDKIEFLSKLSNSTLLELIIESAKIFMDLFIYLLIDISHSFFFLVFVIFIYQSLICLFL